MRKRVFSQTTLWLVFFGFLNLFVSGRWTVAAAAWLAAAFGLRYLYIHPQRRKFLFFYLVSWLTLSVAWYGATPFLGAPLAHVIFMAVTTLPAVIPYLVDRWLAPRLRRDGHLPFAATLIFPLTVTALEYLTSSTNPLGNFGAVGYSQAGLPVLTQSTAVTGMLGLAFLVSWFPAVVNWAWEEGFAWPRIRAGVAVFAAILAVTIGYGAIRLASAPQVGSLETVPVASFTVAENHLGELNQLLEADEESFRRQTQSVHAAYLATTETAINDGARIVLWPELAIIGLAEDVAATVDQGRTLAQAAGIYLAMPTFTLYPEGEKQAENKMFVAGPDGRLIIEHVKYGGNVIEGTVKGSGEIQSVDTAYGRLAGIICWDTNYPNIVRQVGRQGADILLSPSKEWAGINPMHAEMAVFRAIENGSAVIRQADEGLSIVVDGYGRTLATGEGLADTGNYLLVDVPTSSPTTWYPIIGDLVGQLALAGFVGMVLWAVVAGRRARKQFQAKPA